LPHPDRATTKFSNRPERGVHTAALALDKILSTEQRRRLVTIDRSVFSMFITPLSDEITKEIEEEKLTTEQQIEYDFLTSLAQTRVNHHLTFYFPCSFFFLVISSTLR
jgi:hypothetical protein